MNIYIEPCHFFQLRMIYTITSIYNNYASVTIINCPFMCQSNTDSYLKKNLKAIKCYFFLPFLEWEAMSVFHFKKCENK